MWGGRNESGKSYINFLFRLQEILLLPVMLASANVFSSPEVYCTWFIKMKRHVRENFLLKEGGRVERSFWLIFLAEGLVCGLCGLSPGSRASPPTVSGGKRPGPALAPSTKGSTMLLVASRVAGGTSELTQPFLSLSSFLTSFHQCRDVASFCSLNICITQTLWSNVARDGHRWESKQ